MDAFIKGKISPLSAGLLIGLLAVLAGEWGGLAPPNNYGICTTCHGRDLIVGFAQQLGGLELGLISPISLWPLLTTVGIIIGAGAAQIVEHGKSFIYRFVDWRQKVKSFASGFFVMSFALLAMGCPVRMILRTADLDIQGLVGLIGVGIGVFMAVRWLKIRIVLQ